MVCGMARCIGGHVQWCVRQQRQRVVSRVHSCAVCGVRHSDRQKDAIAPPNCQRTFGSCTTHMKFSGSCCLHSRHRRSGVWASLLAPPLLHVGPTASSHSIHAHCNCDTGYTVWLVRSTAHPPTSLIERSARTPCGFLGCLAAALRVFAALRCLGHCYCCCCCRTCYYYF